MALINECKHNEVPVKIIRAIIKEESSKNPLSVNVNKDGKSLISYRPKNKQKAINIAKEWINKGYSVDIGLMQLNSDNLENFNISLDEAFNPCTNIKISSTIYHNFFKALKKKSSYKKRIYQAFSAYNTGSYTKGFKNGYVKKYFKYFGNYKNEDIKNYAKYLLSLKFPSNIVIKSYK